AMRRFLLAACAAAALMTGWAGPQGTAGQEPAVVPVKTVPGGPGGPTIPGMPEKKLPDFDKVLKPGAKEFDGLFKLYQMDEELLPETTPQQLTRALLCPVAIARGMGMGGFTLNFDEQWVLLFKKVSDTKLHLIRRNVRFQAKPGSPVHKAVEVTYT